MTRLTVNFDSRDFSRPVCVPGVAWTVAGLEWRALGGPHSARLRADGVLGAVGRLGGLLRCPVTVQDERGPAWWGYVSAVTYCFGQARVRLDLDTMGNRVRVNYQAAAADLNGKPATSSWQADSPSMAQYGTKERTWTIGAASEAEAEARAAALLARYARPAGLVGLANTDAAAPVFAMVEARGWWETLDWTYYREDRGWAANIHLGGQQNFGPTAAVAAVAQTFTVGTAEGWTAVDVWLRFKKYRATDSVQMALCQDNAGVPGAALALRVLTRTDIEDDFAWTHFKLGAPVPLQVGVTYWLVLTRLGAYNSTAYFVAAVDQSEQYANGTGKLLVNGVWGALSPVADLCFAVVGEEDTLVQVARIAAATACGQFLSGVQIEPAAGGSPGTSGIKTWNYRAGKQRGAAEIEQLLAVGLAGGGTRLLARVEAGRCLRVYAQPESSTARAVALGSDGRLRSATGLALSPGQQPAGKWVRLEALTDSGLPEGAVFAERVTWERAAGLRLADMSGADDTPVSGAERAEPRGRW